MARYKIFGVTPTARVVEFLFKQDGAPSEARMCGWGKTNSCAIVIRYYPRLKGFRMLDIRQARARPGGKGYVNIRRGKRIYPNESAAIMTAVHALQNDTSQLKLI